MVSLSMGDLLSSTLSFGGIALSVEGFVGRPTQDTVAGDGLYACMIVLTENGSQCGIECLHLPNVTLLPNQAPMYCTLVPKDQAMTVCLLHPPHRHFLAKRSAGLIG